MRPIPFSGPWPTPSWAGSIASPGGPTRGRATAAFQGLTLKAPLIPSFGVAWGDGPQGVFVTRVIPAGIAGKAGVAEGDVVLSINGRKPASALEAMRLLADMKMGEETRLVVRRGQAESTLVIKTDDPSLTVGSSSAGNGPYTFVPLFNGKTLDGWKVDGQPNPWKVAAGELTVSGRTLARRGMLLSEREFGDFRLRLEARLQPAADAGVTIRHQPGGKAMKLNLLAGTANEFNAGTGSLWWPDASGGTGGSREASPKPKIGAGSWHRYEIEAVGPRIVVSVDDAEVQRVVTTALAKAGEDNAALKSARGHIGLQSSVVAEVSLRKIEIEDLAPTAAVPGSDTSGSLRTDPATSPAAPAWRKLITSTDDVTAPGVVLPWDPKSQVTFNDGLLSLRGGLILRPGPNPRDVVIRATVEWKEGENVAMVARGFMLWFTGKRPNLKGSGEFGIGLTPPGKTYIDLIEAVRTPLKHPNRCRLALAVKGSTITAFVDGKKVAQVVNTSRDDGPTGAQVTYGAGTFRDLEIFVLDGTGLSVDQAMKR